MRIVSYVISFLALFLFLNIILSFASPGYKNFLKNTKDHYLKTETVAVVNDTKPKTDYNEKIIKSIEKLNDHITKIEEDSKKAQTDTGIIANTGTLINSWSVKIDELAKIPESIRKKIESLNLKKIENNWIFSIKNLHCRCWLYKSLCFRIGLWCDDGFTKKR